MIFRCNKKELENALESLSTVAGQYKQLDVVDHAMIKTSDDGIILEATDLEACVTAHVRYGRVISEGKALIHVGESLAILKAFDDGPIVIDNESSPLETAIYSDKQGNSDRLERYVPDVDDFPTLIEEEKSGDWSGYLYRDQLIKALDSLKKIKLNPDERRAHITGMMLRGTGQAHMEMVTTDGKCCVLKYISTDGDSCLFDKILVPKKQLYKLKKAFKNEKDALVYVKVRSTYIELSTCDVAVGIKLLDGDFPNMERILEQQSDCSYYLDKKAEFKMCKKMVALNSDQSTVLYVNDVGLEYVTRSSKSCLTSSIGVEFENTPDIRKEVFLNIEGWKKFLETFNEENLLAEIVGRSFIKVSGIKEIGMFSQNLG